MIARRFTSVVWVAAIGTAALACYIFSAQVAEERAGLSDLEAQIRRTEQSIRTLKTELGTRGRVHQLQHWASADFGFTAPTAGQFLEGEVTLASLDAPVAAPALEAPVQTAQAPAPVAELPRAIQAAAPRQAEKPVVRQASAERSATPALRRAVADASITPTATRVAARVPAAARRSAPLVKESTLRELDNRARNESAGRTALRPR
jgi:hypothetical protein